MLTRYAHEDRAWSNQRGCDGLPRYARRAAASPSVAAGQRFARFALY